jgi:hypothetical protein
LLFSHGCNETLETVTNGGGTSVTRIGACCAMLRMRV